MRNLFVLAKSFFVEESGQDLIEYALIIALVALVAVTALQSLATAITTIFTSITTALGAAS